MVLTIRSQASLMVSSNAEWMDTLKWKGPLSPVP
jgi:hypothetical protein